jgi:hypothetical protein
LSPPSLTHEQAELALLRAVNNGRMFVRVVRPDGPLVQKSCQNLPELIAALEQGYKIHPSDA